MRRPDPTLFLGYWNRPEATAAKFVGDWMTTGDRAVADADGYVAFLGRDDDVITSSGFRIGPAEIEESLLRHPAVAAAAVVGVPDALRTEIVKAWVVPRDGVAPSEALAADIARFVRTAPLGARISARRGLHRRPADDRHRQGDAAGAARAGLRVAVSFQPRGRGAPWPAGRPRWRGRRGRPG